MLEALKVIALLCQVSSGGFKATVIEQARCQQYYVECIERDTSKGYGDAISKCILKKKTNKVIR